MILIILVLLLCIYFIYFNKITTNQNEVILTVFMVDGQIKEASRQDIQIGTSRLLNQKVTGTPIDLDNTGEFALFIGGQDSDQDALLVQRNGKWIDLIDQTNLKDRTAKKTYSSVSADLDHNGYTDLVIARDNGVKLYLNQGRGRFIVRELSSKSDQTIPVGLAITDYDKDGNPDIYVSQFTHPDLIRNGSPDEENYLKSDGVEDIVLSGLGTGAFEQNTRETNLDQKRQHGTRNPVFVDLNQDGLPDLVLTNDVGELEVYQNTRGASGKVYSAGPRFKKIKVPTGLGYWNNLSSIVNENGKVGLKLTGQSTQQSTPQSTLQTKKEEKKIKLPSGNKNTAIDNNLESTQKNNSDLKYGWQILMESIGFTTTNPTTTNPTTTNPTTTNPTTTTNTTTTNPTTNQTENKWINVAGPYQAFKKNWIGVRLPDSSPFLNATIYVESYNSKTKKIRRLNKQNLISTDYQSKIVYFDLGDDDHVSHLEVHTIYDGSKWIHPRPRINMIATFRSMLSTPYTAN